MNKILPPAPAPMAQDGFSNLLTALGANNPKVAANMYLPNYQPEQIEAAYRASTWFGKIVDIPADDAVSKWRNWQASPEQIQAIEKTEKRLKVRTTVREAMKWSRLYGGAVIVMGGLPGAPSEPLDPEAVKKDAVKYLTSLPCFDVSTGQIIRDPQSEWYGQPSYFGISHIGGEALQLHPSRVVVMQGRKLARRQDGQFWGDSIWMHLKDAIEASDSAAAIISALMHEAKIDIVRQEGLMDGMVSEQYEALVMRRYSLAAMLKSIGNVLLLDKADEWSQKQINFSGLPAVVEMFLTIMSGASDIPVTRLVGTSAKGLNATGEGDLRNYYDAVKAKQELDIEPAISPLDEMTIRSALGSRPDNIWYQWAPLYQPTRKERAEVDKLEAETVNILVNTALVPDDALAAATQARMVESGSWPGLEKAIADSTMEAGVMDPEPDPAEIDPETGQPRVAADARPQTLYVSRKVKNVAEIRKWAKAQGFESVQDELHVTLIHTRELVDWMKAGDAWSDEITVTAGGPRMMDQFGDARVLLFRSSTLEWRHKEFLDIGARSDHSDYQPHITISWKAPNKPLEEIKPYQGKIVLGPELFETVDEDWKSNIQES